MKHCEIRHFHLFCGIGGGAKGFNNGHARVGQRQARFRCIGGVDNSRAAVRDFERVVGAPGTCLDLFDHEQYVAWHDAEPPADWREATPADIRRSAGNERPHIVFMSAPCKGFSGLLSESRSKGARYQALNRLTLRGVWLTLEAWADDPPELILFENVPRIQNRGRDLLDQIEGLLQHYGYATAETTHDCGEIGALAQSRRRFLLVARHQEKVPPFLYEPHKHRLRSVGDVLDDFPVPDNEAGGPMHRVPALEWRTWVRLALVEAGSDWRSLERLRVEGGVLADYGIVPEADYHNGVLGVNRWDEAAGTITGNGRPATGKFSVADPRRHEDRAAFGQFGVKRWDETGAAVSGKAAAGSGPYSIADPRPNWQGNASPAKFRTTPWGAQVGTIIGSRAPSEGAASVADPRIGHRGKRFNNVYRVIPWGDFSPSVTSGGGPTSGGYAIADPRTGFKPQRDTYQTGGHYGVVPWDGTSYAVPGKAKHDRGPMSVADPRLPEPNDRGVYVIRALDDTWHRPFTTLELAALQGLVDPDDDLVLDGNRDGAWRERIGNAVPSPAAQAVAGVMGETLLLAWSGETFTLGSTPIWVQPLAIALSVDTTHHLDGRAYARPAQPCKEAPCSTPQA